MNPSRCYFGRLNASNGRIRMKVSRPRGIFLSLFLSTLALDSDAAEIQLFDASDTQMHHLPAGAIVTPRNDIRVRANTGSTSLGAVVIALDDGRIGQGLIIYLGHDVTNRERVIARGTPLTVTGVAPTFAYDNGRCFYTVYLATAGGVALELYAENYWRVYSEDTCLSFVATPTARDLADIVDIRLPDPDPIE